jgi:hypothetical protein
MQATVAYFGYGCVLQAKNVYEIQTCGLHHKHIMIINDALESSVSDAPNCGITYDRN